MVTQPLSLTLSDPAAERVRRSHAGAITAQQASAFGDGAIVAGVSLPDSTVVIISHGLGRAPVWVAPSCPQGATSAGVINQTFPAGVDPTKQIALTATGFGATITCSVGVA